MKETFGTIVGYIMLAPFAHVVAAIALVPLLFFSQPGNRSFRKVAAGVLLCAVWWAVCLGAVEFSQFSQSPGTIGLFMGASANLGYVWVRELIGKEHNIGTAATWIAIYASPALGYGIALLVT